MSYILSPSLPLFSERRNISVSLEGGGGGEKPKFLKKKSKQIIPTSQGF